MPDPSKEERVDLTDPASVVAWLTADGEGQFPAAHEYDWAYIPAFELKQLLEHYYDPPEVSANNRRAWAKLYQEEWDGALSGCWDLQSRQELEEEMTHWEDVYFAYPQAQPIIAVAGPEGLPQIKVWDGVRRIGFAATRRWHTIPMLLGTPKR